MDGFAAWLWERGYSQATAYPYIRVIADFSRFLERKDFGAGEVDESRANEFLRHRRRRRLHRGDWAALRLLMKHMRETGAISLPSPAIVVDEFVSLERAFATYLLREKGLSPATEKTTHARSMRSFATDSGGGR